MLSTRFARLRQRDDGGNKPPAAGYRVNASLGLAIKFRIRPIARVKLVQLRAARGGMPRISINLRELNGAAKIHTKPAAVGTLVKKEVRARLILFSRQQSICKRAQIGAV